MTAPMRRAHRRPTAMAGLLVAVLLVLAGCVGIPTSGPMGVGVEGVSDQGAVEPLGDPPPQDGAPEDIVRGFLGASAAGFSRDTATSESGDDFRNAREYLSGEARRSWSPRERVVVYSTASSPDIKVGDSQVEVTVRVAARIDADGRYAQAGPDARESVVFDLVEDGEGQWRISGLEDGVVLSEPNFEAIYRSVPLYFLSQDGRFLVPETRWSRCATSPRRSSGRCSPGRRTGCGTPCAVRSPRARCSNRTRCPWTTTASQLSASRPVACPPNRTRVP